MKKDLMFRWAVLIIVFMNVIFNVCYGILTQSPEPSQVTITYSEYFKLAPYASSVWAIIFLAFILYSLIQISPSQRKFAIYDRLAVPVILINCFNVVWIIFYTQNFIGGSLFILALTLFVAFYAFRKACLAVQYRDFNLWLQFPFSLLTGWLTVILSLNFFVYLHYLGWTFNLEEGVLTAVVIIANTIIGYFISVRTFSLVYPAAICWGLISINVQIRNEVSGLAGLALGCAIFLMVATLAASVSRKIKHPASKVHHSIDF